MYLFLIHIGIIPLAILIKYDRDFFTQVFIGHLQSGSLALIKGCVDENTVGFQ